MKIGLIHAYETKKERFTIAIKGKSINLVNSKEENLYDYEDDPEGARIRNNCKITWSAYMIVDTDNG